jgi:hypothetical protein
VAVATLGLLPSSPMLPLAWTVSLLLLLSSLSLQALALQTGSLQALQQRRRQQEDQLMTAAQQLAGRLQRRHGCLLPLDGRRWRDAGCATAAELAALHQGEAGDQPWQLLGYSQLPASAGKQRDGSGELLLRQGERAAAFALHWRWQEGEGPPRLLGVQHLGVRELRP